MWSQFFGALLFALAFCAIVFFVKPTKEKLHAEASKKAQQRRDNGPRTAPRPASDYDTPRGDRPRPEPEQLDIKPEDYDRATRGDLRLYRLIATVLIIGGVALTIFANSARVDAKTAGIGTDFGRPVVAYDNGFHWKPFWRSVHNLSAAIQTDNYVQNNKSADDDKCDTGVKVRLANQSVACANITVRWQIEQSAATDLYKNHKDLDKIRDSLVTRNLTAIANDEFGTYDPLANIDDVAKGVNTGSKPGADANTLGTFAEHIRTKLQEQVGAQVKIWSVTVPIVDFDKQTEDKINLYQAAIADTRIAVQKEKTAQAEARANKTLSDSLKDPNVNVNNCLGIERDMLKKGLTPPPAHCSFGNNNGLIVDGTSKK